MCSGECCRYSWNQAGDAAAAAATSSTVWFALVDTVIRAPTSAAPRRVASSPSGWAMPW